MAQVESISQHILRGLEQLHKECEDDGFLTQEEDVVSRLLELYFGADEKKRSSERRNFTPTARNEVFPVQEITADNIFKMFYANGMNFQSPDDIKKKLKSMGTSDFIINAFAPTYQSLLRAIAWGMQEQLMQYLRRYKPLCTLSFQELISPDNVALMLIYVTFTPTHLTEQVTLYLGMIPIMIKATSDGQRHVSLLRNLNIFIAENFLGEYFAECLTAVNATPDCSVHELLLGDCLLAVVNKKHRPQDNRVVWCCNTKIVIHRVLNALHLIFSTRSFHRSKTSHRFSDMFQFSIYFITRLQTFFISYMRQIKNTMAKMNVSLQFEKLYFSHKIVASSFRRTCESANMLSLPFIVEEVPLLLRILEELVADRDNWDSSLRMCSKAWVLRRVLQQPNFLAFMILLKKTVQALSLIEVLEEKLNSFNKQQQVEQLKKSIYQIMSALRELRNNFPCTAFDSYEIKSKCGSWIPLNRRDNIDLGFNPSFDNEIRFTNGNYHVSFAATRFNENDQIERIFNDLRKSTKSSFCKYTKDYDLFSKFLNVDFLPLCTENRKQYFDIILDEIRHFSSLDAIEALCDKKTNTCNRNDDLKLARLNALHFEGFDSFAKGAYYVNQLSADITVERFYVETAEAFIGIAQNGVGVDRFTLSIEDFTKNGINKNLGSDKGFSYNSKEEFIEKLFAM